VRARFQNVPPLLHCKTLCHFYLVKSFECRDILQRLAHPVTKTELMHAKRILIIGVAVGLPVPLFADALVSGSVYFDSEKTYEEVKRLAAQGDNEGISKLIADRHVSQPVTNDVEVSVIPSAQTPYGLVEFRFHDGTIPYWSLAKCVKPSSPDVPVAEPSPVPNLSQEASENLPAATPSPSHHVVHHAKRRMHRYWHLVNGHLYWSPVPLKGSDETSARSQ
jgi:hypothetical protein